MERIKEEDLMPVHLFESIQLTVRASSSEVFGLLGDAVEGEDDNEGEVMSYYNPYYADPNGGVMEIVVDSSHDFILDRLAGMEIGDYHDPNADPEEHNIHNEKAERLLTPNEIIEFYHKHDYVEFINPKEIPYLYRMIEMYLGKAGETINSRPRYHLPKLPSADVEKMRSLLRLLREPTERLEGLGVSLSTSTLNLMKLMSSSALSDFKTERNTITLRRTETAKSASESNPRDGLSDMARLNDIFSRKK